MTIPNDYIRFHFSKQVDIRITVLLFLPPLTAKRFLYDHFTWLRYLLKRVLIRNGTGIIYGILVDLFLLYMITALIPVEDYSLLS